MSTFFESMGGRKLVLVVLAIVAVVLVGLLRELDATKIMDTIVYLVGIGAGSIAVEDGLKGLGSSKDTKAPPSV